MKLRTSKKWFTKICKVLNECEIRLQKAPRIGRRYVNGHCDGTTIAIRNNPYEVNIELTLIHETLHHIYPKWTEKKVDKVSRNLLCEFSTSQLKSLERYLEV